MNYKSVYGLLFIIYANLHVIHLLTVISSRKHRNFALLKYFQNISWYCQKTVFYNSTPYRLLTQLHSLQHKYAGITGILTQSCRHSSVVQSAPVNMTGLASRPRAAITPAIIASASHDRPHPTLLLQASTQLRDLMPCQVVLSYRHTGQYFLGGLSHLCPKIFRQHPKKLLIYDLTLPNTMN